MTGAQPLTGYAFPLIVVKHHGPTNYRAGRFVATLKRWEGMSGTVTLARASVSDQSEEASSTVRMAVAVACWENYQSDPARVYVDDEPTILIPIDLWDGTSGYAVMPSRLLDGAALMDGDR